MVSSNPATVDLLSFDSWDYDGSGGDPSLAITNSLSGEESIFSLSSTGTGQSSAFKSQSDHLVRLNVSGTTFCVEPHVFSKLEPLPWTAATHNADDHHDFYLSTAPELFEMILGHVLYGSFPDVRQLRTADVEELEPLVMLLGLQSLQRHLGLYGPWVGKNNVPKKTSTSATMEDQHQSKKPRRVPSFRRLEERSISLPNISEGGGPVRRMVQKTLMVRRGNSQRRLTHAEACASDVVN